MKRLYGNLGGDFAYMLARKNGMAQFMFDSIVGLQGVINNLEAMKLLDI